MRVNGIRGAAGVMAALALAGSAQAGVVFSDNFDGENGGLTALNYASFANFNVSGAVDLTRNGDYYPCAGGGGSCVDLAGTADTFGRLTTKSSFAFGVGDVVTLRVAVAGNRRGQPDDQLNLGFDFGGATDITCVGLTSPAQPTSPCFTPMPGVLGQTVGFTVAANEGFANYAFSFMALTGGTLRAYAGTFDTDNVGAVIDNVSLSIDSPGAAVPEPATWALMLLGFGGLGAVIRGRRGALA
jgi:hypothetical protein